MTHLNRAGSTLSVLAAIAASQNCPDALKGLKQTLLKSTESSSGSEPKGLIFRRLQALFRCWGNWDML